MEEKSAERRSKIVKISLVVAGMSVTASIINILLGWSTTSGGENVENIFIYIHFSFIGLFFTAIIGMAKIIRAPVNIMEDKSAKRRSMRPSM